MADTPSINSAKSFRFLRLCVVATIASVADATSTARSMCRRIVNAHPWLLLTGDCLYSRVADNIPLTAAAGSGPATVPSQWGLRIDAVVDDV
jgi:hypothetical protein